LDLAESTIRFGGGSNQSGEPSHASDVPRSATRCPSCQRNFSQNAEFCPYDGEKLESQEIQVLARDELIGAVIDDRYEVLSVIGEGGMGRVYRIRHRRLGRTFALKALRPELSTDSVLTQRFVQEARAAAVVVHPNVVQINDFGTLSTGQPYFVMELLEGRTLTRILRDEGPIEPQRCVAIARQIAEALGAAHAMSVIHRDLKPDNIMLIRPAGSRMTVKVLDFGLAKVAANSRLTRPGVVFGTPHYMSPEQASGEAYDHRVDVYALGIIIFEMVTGRVPFEADTYMGVLSKHLYAVPPRAREFHGPSGAIPEIEDIISRCLAKKPADRWPSMTELARNLSSLSSQLEAAGHAVSPSLTQRVRESRHSSFVQPLSLYALGVSAYVLCGFFLVWSVLSNAFTAKHRTETKPVLVSLAPSYSAPLGSPPSGPDAGVTALPEHPSANPAIDSSAPVTPPQKGGLTPGRLPPVAKHGKTTSKPGGTNRKKPLLGSGDLADPWAK
jgi:eukaryotic-like serine/threonine-protein kinase